MHIVFESRCTKCLKTFYGYNKYSSATGINQSSIWLYADGVEDSQFHNYYYLSFKNRLKQRDDIVVKHIVAFNLWY